MSVAYLVAIVFIVPFLTQSQGDEEPVKVKAPIEKVEQEKVKDEKQ